MKTTNNISKEPTVAYGNSVQQMKAQIVEAVNATNNAKILEKLLLIIKKQKVSKCGMDEAIDDIQKGRVYKAESVDDMFKQILG